MGKKIIKWSEFLAESSRCKSKIWPVGSEFLYDSGELPAGLTSSDVHENDILNLQKHRGLTAAQVPGKAADWLITYCSQPTNEDPSSLEGRINDLEESSVVTVSVGDQREDSFLEMDQIDLSQNNKKILTILSADNPGVTIGEFVTDNGEKVIFRAPAPSIENLDVSVEQSSDTTAPDNSKIPTTAKVVEILGESIVNDITTGGDGKSLSAEMGKEIGKVINASTKTLTKGTGGVITIANDGHYVDKNNGSIKSSGDQFISNSFRVSGDSQITIECAYAPAGSPVSMVLPEGSTYPYRPISVTHKNLGSTHSYTAQIYETGDYVFSGNRSGVYKVTIVQKSVRDSLGTHEKTLNENSTAIGNERNVRSLIPGTDYRVNTGQIRAGGDEGETGTLNAGTTAYQYTSPIHLKKFEKIEFAPFSTAALGYICLTDESGSYHKPIISKSAGSTATDLISYIADETCYVALCTSTGHIDATGTGKSNIKIYSGYNQVAESIGVIAARQARRDAIYDARPRRDSREYVEREAALKAADDKAFAEARIERLESIRSVKALCPNYNFDPNDDSQDAADKEHICHIEKNGTTYYLEGVCGYTEEAGENNTTVLTPTMFWHILDNGVLYIHGYGKMYDFLKGTQKHKNLLTAEGYSNGNTETTPSLPEWYYGFVTNNQGYTNPVPVNDWKHDSSLDKVVYDTPRVYFDAVTYGDVLNPFCNKPNGYAAPWYPYRREINYRDTSYETFANYKLHNPQLFTYDKVAIEPDTSNDKPGITYIGMWAFYKCLVKNLVIPNGVQTIAEWGIRFSDCMETLVIENGVTTCESMVCSRMGNLRHLRLPTTLTNIGDDCMGSELGLMERLYYPNSLTSIGRHVGENMKGLRSLHLPSSMTTIPTKGVYLPDDLGVIEIPEGVTTIESNGILINFLSTGDVSKKDIILVLPSTLSSIDTTGIDSKRLAVVIYKSTNVPYNLRATYVVVKSNATFNDANYTKIKSVSGYDYYYKGLIY